MSRTHSIFSLFFLLSTSILFAQKDLNAYKYIVVPNQYEFQKSEDQYQINSLLKFLFEKEGYNVYSTATAFPQDLAQSPCLALKAIVNNDSGMLSTKVTISLVDCYNTVVFTSIEGKSKIKDYKKAYHEAIRNAFVGIQELEYEYTGSENTNLNIVEKNTENITESKVEVVPAATLTEVDKKPENPVVASEISEPVTQNNVIEANEISSAQKVAETAVIIPVVVSEKSNVNEVKSVEKTVYSIEGKYFIDMWGECVISKKGDGFAVVGGDQNFEFATISKTSKPTIFMVKKTGFTQSQLLELTEDGNLQIDTDNGVKVFKRVD